MPGMGALSGVKIRRRYPRPPDRPATAAPGQRTDAARQASLRATAVAYPSMRARTADVFTSCEVRAVTRALLPAEADPGHSARHTAPAFVWMTWAPSTRASAPRCRCSPGPGDPCMRDVSGVTTRRRQACRPADGTAPTGRWRCGSELFGNGRPTAQGVRFCGCKVPPRSASRVASAAHM